MSTSRRIWVCLIFLGLGLAARGGVERAVVKPRPLLKARLATIPKRLGEWIGDDAALDPAVAEKTQADDYLNRIYVDSRDPARRLVLWMNYSKHGLNLRHSPEVCLPSGGWTKIDVLCRPISVNVGGSRPLSVYQLGYRQGELVETIGFWYYIFGESSVERILRDLPMAGKSGYGRATRGSGLTVEVFVPEASGQDGKAIGDFIQALWPSLEPILPANRAAYYLP